ncbi:MAG: hypothetical protein H6732_08140 [Alphaproteobacteria bacterium]|nr:hypothetical protein [Alphaproteobacteria bacterium]
MWTLLLWTGLALGGEDAELVCPKEPRARLVEAAEAVEAAWLGLDLSGFDVARNRLGRLTLCVDSPLEVGDALVLHRARALVALVDRDPDAARRSFAAVHLLQPSWQPDDSVPREHQLWKVFASAVDDDEAPKTVAFRTLPEAGWSVDGTRFPRPDDPRDASGRLLGEYGLPADRAFVLQVFDARERVTYTGYHFSTTDLPIEDLLVTRYADTVQARKRRRAARIAGSVIGGALLAAGGTTFGLGWQQREQFTQDALPLEEQTVLEAQGQANLLSGTSYGLAGAGALALTLAWAVPW